MFLCVKFVTLLLFGGGGYLFSGADYLYGYALVGW